MSPEEVVTQYFEVLIRNKEPDFSFFAKEPNFIMKKIYKSGAKNFVEFLGAKVMSENEKKASVLYAITNTKGVSLRFVCQLKKVNGEWKIKTFDNYDLG